MTLHYDDVGHGYPLLLLAPGGMHSRMAMWGERPQLWFDPMVELADEFRVIGMDQRNAGQSHAPVTATDGWHTYVSDAVALLDHLGIDEFAVMGGCIGASFGLGLCAAVPGRVRAAVLLNPIGASPDGHDHFGPMFDEWAEHLRRTRADVEPSSLAALRTNLFAGDFVFSVSRDFLRSCVVPLLVLPGHDAFHPAAIAEEIAQLAPHAALIERWRPSEIGRDSMVSLVREFLREHTRSRR